MILKIKNIPRNSAIFFIYVYKRLLSPCLPPSCRFYPTCSQYAIQSFRKYGFFIGSFKSFIRICKCNPWHKGGYDPVN